MFAPPSRNVRPPLIWNAPPPISVIGRSEYRHYKGFFFTNLMYLLKTNSHPLLLSLNSVGIPLYLSIQPNSSGIEIGGTDLPIYLRNFEFPQIFHNGTCNPRHPWWGYF
jgi:hypothetical protein